VVNINKLRGRIIENGLNVETLAGLIGIDRATLYRRLNDGGETFLIKEVSEISRVLNLSNDDINAIFFAQPVA